VGGECSYFGCIPSKTLLRPGDVVVAARNARRGEAVMGPIDLRAALTPGDYMTSSWMDDTQVPPIDMQGIDLVRGPGRLARPKRWMSRLSTATEY
jgi:pyruvate/2-oxoglutarate dehydrogenase complex dihydrolipoamide dehydrogenase (E3) component